jgi:hypothetical protein
MFMPEGLLTMLLMDLMQQNVLLLLYMTVPQSSAMKWKYFLANVSLFFFILNVRSGFWMAFLDGIFSVSLMRWLICYAETVATSGT